MTALAAGRVTKEYVPRTVERSYLMPAAQQIWEGGIVVINANGYAVPGSTALGLTAVGVAQQSKLSGSSAGVDSISVHLGVFSLATDATFPQTAIGQTCYIVDDQTVSLNPVGKSVAGIVDSLDSTGANAFVVIELAAAGESGGSGNIAPGPVTIPVVLAAHSNGSIAARFTPNFDGQIDALTASVVNPATTGSKLATFTPAVATVATTGGALALTSANCTPVGAKVNASAITAGGSFTSGQEITIAASSVTAFIEGEVVLYLYLSPA